MLGSECKVYELIEKLKKLPPESNIIIGTCGGFGCLIVDDDVIMEE